MAEEKEEKGKGDPLADKDFYALLGEILGVILLVLLLTKFLRGFSGGASGGISGSGGPLQAFFSYILGKFLSIAWVDHVIIAFIIFSNIFSVVLVILIAYILIQIHGIEVERQKSIEPIPQEGAAAGGKVKNEKWQAILNHISSDNPGNWRLAILEGDIMLDDLLDTLGYIGDTMGDKLKKVDPAHFRTLNSAWEAHRIRNAIAHEGQDFSITKREAVRIIRLYESIFKEFGFI